MARWRKNESLSWALVRECKGVAKELLSIATLGVYRPAKRDRNRAEVIRVRTVAGQG